MDVVVDTIKGFDTQSGTSKAGKPYTVNLVVFDTFGVVSLGFNKPDAIGLKVGEKTAVEVEFKYGKWEYQRTVDVDTEPTMATPPAKSSGSGGFGGFTPRAPKPFPVPDNHGDMSIIHQNSLAHAVKISIHNASVGTGSKNVKAEDVIAMAYEFAAFSSGAHLEKLAKEK